MYFCQVKLPQREKYISEVSTGILNSYGVIRVPNEYVPVDFYSFVVITAFDKTSGVIPYYVVNQRNGTLFEPNTLV